MQSLSESQYLEYNSDTLDHIRREYGIDEPIRMIEMIDILEEWVKKQKHFVVKTLPRKYLERLIIFNKGSVEKTKGKLDKICTIRTLLPELFENHNIDELSECQDAMMDVMLPKMTPDYCRVYIFKARNKIKIDADVSSRYFKLFLIMSDYLQLYDYNQGIIYLVDWRDGNMMDFVLSCSLTEFRRTTDIGFEGYSMRIKGIHILTESKAVNSLVTLFKQVMSAKVGSRIQVHSSMDTVYKYIDKGILPVEYGGTEKPLLELRDDLLRELKSDHFIKYRREMSKARTDESYRQKDNFNDYMGMPGTFRTLSVD